MKQDDCADLQTEVEAIKADAITARDIIRKGMMAYIRKRLKVRSNKLAKDMQLRFKDLELYDSKDEILDYYGYGYITEAEKNRLYELWDMREKFVDDNNHFSDRVTEILEHAISACDEKFRDVLDLAEHTRRESEMRERKDNEAFQEHLIQITREQNKDLLKRLNEEG